MEWEKYFGGESLEKLIVGAEIDINHLKVDSNLNYSAQLNLQFVPRSEHTPPPFLKSNQLILYRKMFFG